jgi:acetamidase/formamidase
MKSPTYVANTGRFHRNEGLRHDFFMLNELEYAEIGVSEARRLIAAGVGALTEEWQADALDRWQRDAEAMAVETVFASHIADLA